MLKVQKLTCGNDDIETRDHLLGASMNTGASNEHLEKSLQTHMHKDIETKVPKQSWKMMPSPDVSSVRTRDQLNNCMPRSRENIALAEFMASMAAQRSAGWTNSLVERKIRSDEAEHSKYMPVSNIRGVPEQTGREDLNHFTDEFRQEDHSSKRDGSFWVQRKFHEKEKVLIMDGKTVISNEIRESITQTPFWVSAAGRNSNCVAGGHYSPSRKELDEFNKRNVPLVMHQTPAREKERHLSISPVDDAGIARDHAQDMLRPSQDHTKTQCHRVSVIHYHSSSPADKNIPTKEINENTETDLYKNHDTNHPNKTSEHWNNSSEEPSISDDAEQTHASDFKTAYYETSHPQVLSGFNEPFVPTDDRAIGEHFASPGITRKSFCKDLFVDKRHDGNRSSWVGLQEINFSHKRVYPFLNVSCVEGIVKDSKYIKSDNMPIEKIKIENVKQEPDEDLTKTDSEYEPCDRNSSSASDKSSHLMSKDPQSNDEENDNEDHGNWETKSRFVNIAPKPEQKKSQGGRQEIYQLLISNLNNYLPLFSYYLNWSLK
jgi:hypothetical protein